MTIPAASVVVGGLKTLNLVGDKLGLTDGGGFWGAIGTLDNNFGVLGHVIVGLFVAWLVSFATEYVLCAGFTRTFGICIGPSEP